MLSSLALLAFAIRPAMSPGRRIFTLSIAAILAVVALINGVTFYVLLTQNRMQAGVPVPLSFLIAAFLTILFWRLKSNVAARSRAVWLVVLAWSALWALLFPLAQMFFFGKTDYRRAGNIAVVFGARAYADGRPSDALADRVNTACALYRAGTVSKLIFSGGPGDGSIHETESMRRAAIARGVKDEDIILDAKGVSTQATVDSTVAFLRSHATGRVLAVSHYFHLPRIKMAYQRSGLEVYTIPARESYVLRQTPYLLARETAAWWVYYLRPLFA